MNVLDFIIEIISNEVKEENENSRQVILAILSAWTKNPQNLRILAPSGEGKTYLVTKISRLFPQDKIIILQNATPQSFKYLITKKIIETSPGNFEEYQAVIDRLERIDNKRKKIKELQENTYDFVDLTRKTIIFVDAQSFHLWESLKPILSHDQPTLKSFSVNKSKSGTIQVQKIIFRGHPAVIYCSAKDEQSLDRTDEINTRFNTISLNSTQKKYRQMLELTALRASIPDCIDDEEIVSSNDIEKAKQLILGMISNAERFSVINPFADLIQRQFHDDAGYKARQLGILLNNINLHTLANAKYRPKFSYKNTTSIISTLEDVVEANRLTKRPTVLPPAKIQFFNRYVRVAILQADKSVDLVHGKVKCLTASEIADFVTEKGITTDRKKLQETYLKPYSDHGYLEEFQDPDSRNRNLYSLPAKYLHKEAMLESILIDNIDVDASCVESFVHRIITRRLEQGKLEDANGTEITPKTLLDVILNRRVGPGFRYENGNIETSMNVKGETNQVLENEKIDSPSVNLRTNSGESSEDTYLVASPGFMNKNDVGEPTPGKFAIICKTCNGAGPFRLEIDTQYANFHTDRNHTVEYLIKKEWEDMYG
ncbi:MAG: hypothetical protein LDL06_05200 [Candidatus Nitrosotenuis sp.]|nr:hypothetical protein [Candidatus Nitrosotenuis sp.]